METMEEVWGRITAAAVTRARGCVNWPENYARLLPNPVPIGPPPTLAAGPCQKSIRQADRQLHHTHICWPRIGWLAGWLTMAARGFRPDRAGNWEAGMLMEYG